MIDVLVHWHTFPIFWVFFFLIFFFLDLMTDALVHWHTFPNADVRTFDICGLLDYCFDWRVHGLARRWYAQTLLDRGGRGEEQTTQGGYARG